MTTEQTPAPKPEVTGYGYLTDSERKAAIEAHERAVAKNAKG